MPDQTRGRDPERETRDLGAGSGVRPSRWRRTALALGALLLWNGSTHGGDEKRAAALAVVGSHLSDRDWWFTDSSWEPKLSEEGLRRCCVWPHDALAVKESDALARLRAMDVVLVVDRHTLPSLPWSLVRAVQSLVEPGKRGTVVLEAVPASEQATLDEAMRATGVERRYAVQRLFERVWPFPVAGYVDALTIDDVRRHRIVAGGPELDGHTPLPWHVPDGERTGFPGTNWLGWERQTDRSVLKAVTQAIDVGAARPVVAFHGVRRVLEDLALPSLLRARGLRVGVLVPLDPAWEWALRVGFGSDGDREWYEVLPDVFRPPWLDAAALAGMGARRFEGGDQRFVADLTSDNPKWRLWAAQDLLGSPGYLNDLANVFTGLAQDADRDIRAYAMRLSGETRGSPQAMAVLLRGLDDKDRSVRSAACWALKSMEGDISPALPRVRELLRSGDGGDRADAAEVLGSRLLAGGEVVPVLLADLTSERPRLYEKHTIITLGRYGVLASEAEAVLRRWKTRPRDDDAFLREVRRAADDIAVDRDIVARRKLRRRRARPRRASRDWRGRRPGDLAASETVGARQLAS